MRTNKKNKISIGQHYRIDGYGEYLLCTTDGTNVCLMHLTSGNRFVNSIPVEDIFNMTRAELKKVCNNNPYKKTKESGYK